MLAAAAACGSLGPDLDQVIALSVTADSMIEEFDTLRPQAAALNGRGDPVATTILWATLDTGFLRVVNNSTGVMVAKQPGTARIQARVGNLRSNPIPVRVLEAADSLVAAGRALDTVIVSMPDSLSDTLRVELADTTAGNLAGLAGRPVVWTITDPAASTAVTLVTSDTAHALVEVDTVSTNVSGVAAIQVRLIAPPQPDSVVVTAAARRAVGTTVPGSPVTFVVRFLP